MSFVWWVNKQNLLVDFIYPTKRTLGTLIIRYFGVIKYELFNQDRITLLEIKVQTLRIDPIIPIFSGHFPLRPQCPFHFVCASLFAPFIHCRCSITRTPFRGYFKIFFNYFAILGAEQSHVISADQLNASHCSARQKLCQQFVHQRLGWGRVFLHGGTWAGIRFLISKNCKA